MITNLKKEFKILEQKAMDGSLTQTEIEEFKNEIENVKDANDKLKYSHVLKYEKKAEMLEELIKLDVEGRKNYKIKNLKKKIVSNLVVVGSAGIILSLAHGCSNKNNVPVEEPTTIEQTTEAESETENELETEEKAKENKNDALEKVKEDAIGIGEVYVSSGYMVQDVDTFADYLASYSIVQNSENLSIRDFSEILSDGSFTSIKGQTAVQNITDFYGTIISNNGYDFKNIQSNELRNLMVKIDKKVQTLKTATPEKRIEICNEIKNLVDGGITLGNNVAISANDLYAAYSYALMTDQITASAGGVNIYLANFVNSLPCQNASVIYDLKNGNDVEINSVQFTNSSTTIDNRASMLNIISNDLKERIEMAIAYGIKDESEYSYSKLVDEISDNMKKMINENESKNTISFNDLINEYINERTTYLDSLNNINIVDENDIVIEKENGDKVIIDPTDMKNHDTTSKQKYEEAVKKEQQEKDKQSQTFVTKEKETIATGENAEEVAKKYKEDYENGSVAGAKKGYEDGYQGNKSNPNIEGSKGYKDGYRESYLECYSIGKANRTKKPQEKVEKETLAKPIVTEESTTIETIQKPIVEKQTEYIEDVFPTFESKENKEIISIEIDNQIYYGYYDNEGNFMLANPIVVEENVETKTK